MENLKSIFKPVGELLTDQQLKEKNLMVDPVEVKTDQSYPIDQGDVTFSIGAQASLTAQLFNDENDVDEEEFISTKSTSNIVFKPETQAYLKYQMRVVPKGNASGSLESIGFEFEASADLKATYYKGHANNEKIRQAFLDDATHFLTIFKWKDVEKLGVNDALSFNVGGKLSAGVKVSWSNIFSQSLSLISSSLPVPLTVEINLTPKLTASFNVTVEDHFSYFIKRTKADQLFVAISKIKNTKNSAGLGASVGITFSEPDELEKQLNIIVEELVKAIIKKSGSEVEKALKKVKSGAGSSAQKNLIAEVAEVLGISGETDLITKLEGRWEELKEDLRKVVKKVATVNIELSFTYEYERIKEGKELLSMNISDAGLKKYHPGLLRFKLRDLLTDLGKESVSGAEVLSYINQHSLIIKKTWGLGLKLFSKKFLEGKDFEESEETVRKDLKGHKQVSQQYTSGYKWKLGKGNGKWITELIARMKNYSASPEPLFSEVEFAWYLNMITYDSKVKEHELKAYLDMGVLWGSIQQLDVSSLFEKYLPLLKNKPATFESKLILSELATRTIIQQIGFHQFDKTNQELMARSLAASMRYVDDFPMRTDVKAREEAYTPLWLHYFKNPNESTRNLAYTSYDHLRKQPNANPGLLAAEKSAGLSNQGLWFADVVYTNPPYRACDMLLKALYELSTKLNANAPLAGNFIEAAKKISAISRQSFFVKSLGSLLNRYALQNNMLKTEVQRVFTITYDDNGEERVINFAVV